MFDSICTTTECWSATGSMLAGWAAWGGVAAVFYAANKAANTFKSYRRQKQEERRIDAAERILTLAYKLKRNLRAVRSPMNTSGEHTAAHELLKEAAWYKDLPENRQRRAQIGQIIKTRLHQSKSDIDDIFVVMPLARALFGEHVETYLQALWQQIVHVNVSSEGYAEDTGQDKEYSKSLERDIWEIGGKYAAEDKVGLAFSGAVEGLEAELLPIIRADHPRT